MKIKNRIYKKFKIPNKITYLKKTTRISKSILKVSKYDLIKILNFLPTLIKSILRKYSRKTFSLKVKLKMKGVLIVKGSKIFQKNIEEFISRYLINDLEIIPGNQNISFPICDELTMLKIYGEFRNQIFQYYQDNWSMDPILQDCPRLVISYPHTSYELSGGFPEKFHKDYLTELTVHVPIIDINDSMPHTEYIETSHLKPRLIDLFINKKINQSYKNPKKLLCKKGDYIIMDVSGLHRGSLLSKRNPRIMLQYKFVGRAFEKECNLLKAFKEDAKKIIRQTVYSKNHIAQYSKISSKAKSHCLRNDDVKKEDIQAIEIFNLIEGLKK